SKPNGRDAVTAGDLERERGARVPVPDFDRIDAMPVRALTGTEQEINRRRKRAALGVMARVTEGFAEVPPFRMRVTVDQTNDLGRAQSVHASAILEHASAILEHASAILEFVLAPAYGRESLHRRRPRQADRGRNLGQIGAQERIGLLLGADR